MRTDEEELQPFVGEDPGRREIFCFGHDVTQLVRMVVVRPSLPNAVYQAPACGVFAS
jgi:hypothetical protein